MQEQAGTATKAADLAAMEMARLENKLANEYKMRTNLVEVVNKQRNLIHSATESAEKSRMLEIMSKKEFYGPVAAVLEADQGPKEARRAMSEAFSCLPPPFRCLLTSNEARSLLRQEEFPRDLAILPLDKLNEIVVHVLHMKVNVPQMLPKWSPNIPRKFPESSRGNWPFCRSTSSTRLSSMWCT
jgi:hypothetical protein